MHRSASTTRVLDEFFASSPVGKPSLSAAASGAGHRSMLEIDQLPMYDPQSDVFKKETSRIKSAENAVHFIPVILVLCGLVLWLFSASHIEMVNKDSALVDRIENITIDGYINEAISSLDVEQEDFETVKRRVGSGTIGKLLT